MKALLDTHTFLWASSNPAQLGVRARELFDDPACQLLLSAGSVWEIAIKTQAGKLRLPTDLSAFLATQRRALRLADLPISLEHASAISTLPMLHKDPFDRILIAQAQLESVPIITGDPQIARYPVQVIW